MTFDSTNSTVSATESILSFLNSASRDPHISEELRQIASHLFSKPNNVPYKLLRAIWVASDVANRPKLAHLLSGSEVVLTSPKPREKCEELKERLRKRGEEPFSSYKDQLGFGLHVVLIMFTSYLVGYAAFRALFDHSPAMNAAGGILGLIGGMLVETLLFIIRTSS